MTLHGTIRYRELGAGVWVLEGDDGRTYELAGGDRGLKRDGHRAVLEGELEDDAVSAAMVGPLFHVRRYRLD